MQDGVYRVSINVDDDVVSGDARVRSGVLVGLGALAGVFGSVFDASNDADGTVSTRRVSSLSNEMFRLKMIAAELAHRASQLADDVRAISAEMDVPRAYMVSLRERLARSREIEARERLAAGDVTPDLHSPDGRYDLQLRTSRIDRTGAVDVRDGWAPVPSDQYELSEKTPSGQVRVEMHVTAERGATQNHSIPNVVAFTAHCTWSGQSFSVLGVSPQGITVELTGKRSVA